MAEVTHSFHAQQQRSHFEYAMFLCASEIPFRQDALHKMLHFLSLATIEALCLILFAQQLAQSYLVCWSFAKDCLCQTCRIERK